VHFGYMDIQEVAVTGGSGQCHLQWQWHGEWQWGWQWQDGVGEASASILSGEKSFFWFLVIFGFLGRSMF
jgi:hypothetical protein